MLALPVRQVSWPPDSLRFTCAAQHSGAASGASAS